MKKMLSILFFITPFIIIAQDNAPLRFDKVQHDFGKVKEESDSVSVTFNYQNTSNSTVIIHAVTTSCGCTAGDYKKGPVKKGEKGTIKITYSTTGRVGKFTQPIVVHLSPDNTSTIHLSITGEVLPRKKTAEDMYPILIGNLRFRLTHVAFNKIYTHESKTDTLFMYNNWHKPMSVEMIAIPSFISYEARPAVIPPGKEGIMLITYDASKRGDLGLLFDRLTIKTNDSVHDIKSFHISAEISEDFSKLTLNDMKQAPDMIFETETIDFDTINEGDVIKRAFNFKNTGYSNLILRKIATSCGCTASDVSAEVISSQETGFISIEFNSNNKKGYQRQTITVITNNPHRSTVKLILQGYVRPKG